MKVPRVTIAAPTSGVGKTTVALAVMQALVDRGYKVQPFKVGPDFIDPSYHTMVTGRPSRNLDVWLMGKRGVVESFARASEGADIAVIEGVMGLYDGLSGRDNYASTAHLARILKSPVVLVVDAGKAARSVAAIILGFVKFDRGTSIRGVVLNNVASDRHARYLTEGISSKTKVPILGVLRRDSHAAMEERHLGLVPAQELGNPRRRKIIESSKAIAAQIDIDAMVGICENDELPLISGQKDAGGPTVRIAIALDESFNFYYQDNLDALRRAGARLVYFSPVSDRNLPENIGGIVMGGGFPEVLADRLERNESMKKSIRDHLNQGIPIYAECGGLMYLTRSITGYRGSSKQHQMVGLVDADTIMTGRLTLNYTEGVSNGPLFCKHVLRGHEFHYSRLEHISKDSRFALDLRRGMGIAGGKDGIIVGDSGIAGYGHFHFAAGHLANGIVKACVAHSRR